MMLSRTLFMGALFFGLTSSWTAQAKTKNYDKAIAFTLLNSCHFTTSAKISLPLNHKTASKQIFKSVHYVQLALMYYNLLAASGLLPAEVSESDSQQDLQQASDLLLASAESLKLAPPANLREEIESRLDAALVLIQGSAVFQNLGLPDPVLKPRQIQAIGDKFDIIINEIFRAQDLFQLNKKRGVLALQNAAVRIQALLRKFPSLDPSSISELNDAITELAILNGEMRLHFSEGGTLDGAALADRISAIVVTIQNTAFFNQTDDGEVFIGETSVFASSSPDLKKIFVRQGTEIFENLVLKGVGGTLEIIGVRVYYEDGQTERAIDSRDFFDGFILYPNHEALVRIRKGPQFNTGITKIEIIAQSIVNNDFDSRGKIKVWGDKESN